ncbi:helicase-exonuclease AddAB subunit AddA [Bacillus marinisedimentorum]|uniref:helicase-exonuclease AddAB subunit AddA n=1 Tax=Bacillus marinisedimentorum TaxID=1821260 RepID=UPI0008728D18|nr:helicase-exonuclease AddAB subunit AddA [Bacillus marinisedimentorum]
MISNLPKPENSTWTDEQWDAITASGKDILVAAAAGSGKTAVLVERIIKKITSLENPVDIDRLLVVTFTNAAASEMKKRIGDAIEKELESHPSSLHLRRQLTLINRASISTLHSFCLNVVRKYYYKLDIDPGFRIADGTEADLLMDEVLDELFEEEYGREGNEAFYDLVDRYASDRSDADLQDYARKLYNFSRAHPWPFEWLDNVAEEYENAGKGIGIEDLPWMKDLAGDVNLQLDGMEAILAHAMTLTKEPGGPSAYADNLEDDLRIVQELQAAAKDSWQRLYEEMQTASFSKLKTVRKGEADKDLQDRVKAFREKVKKQIGKLKEELFARSPDAYMQDVREMAPVVRTLVELVKKVTIRYAEAKKERALVDFNDLEHYALSILAESHHQAGGITDVVPSDAAKQYRQQFTELLVDEYQDTNLVQETIIRLIAKPNTEQGNVFMVGDVKQSIYRFRLAEPGLFLSKYKRFGNGGGNGGIKIDLSKNFRSREEVLHGTNFIFKQIMGETVGEIEYDDAAELKPGAAYPPGSDTETELLLVDQQKNDERKQEAPDESRINPDEYETVQLEARLMAKKIKELVGTYQIFDKKIGGMRTVTYRDVVILLRSMPWAPAIMEEFKKYGIPVYAELSTGYFEAAEVSVMLSLLKVIDNPLQDIPLASVLRSPIVDLSENELASIRLENKKDTYFEAVLSYISGTGGDRVLKEKLDRFYKSLEEWRTKARQGALSTLIWDLFGETGYYDFVGGMPGGKQRQANLRALYDRARQYEETSFRGLFRFLRFIERMQERGDDLGAARALGEQEDVVRIMTIHKSKGLEFPVVFTAGLARQFNMMDLHQKVLLHKELGFGSRLINPELRISYPTLPLIAIKRRARMELAAEEMRVLYVALTRARDKLYLIGSVKDRSKMVDSWKEHIDHEDWLLPDYERSRSTSYLDWIGPALVRHRHILETLEEEKPNGDSEIARHPSNWKIDFVKGETLTEEAPDELAREEELMESLRSWTRYPDDSPFADQVQRRLEWRYPFTQAAGHSAKQSVTEMKNRHGAVDENSDIRLIQRFQAPIEKRPRFLQEQKMTAAERGTAMHMVMQQLKVADGISSDEIREQISKMVTRELLTDQQAEAIEPERIADFFGSEPGRRFLNAAKVEREIPFSLAFPAKEAYPEWQGEDQEFVLVQGVIDCLLEDEQGLAIIDYKTDNISNRFNGNFSEAKPVLADRYRTQLNLYQRAVEQIIKKKVSRKYLYFFDGGYPLELD